MIWTTQVKIEILFVGLPISVDKQIQLPAKDDEDDKRNRQSRHWDAITGDVDVDEMCIFLRQLTKMQSIRGIYHQFLTVISAESLRIFKTDRHTSIVFLVLKDECH